MRIPRFPFFLCVFIFLTACSSEEPVKTYDFKRPQFKDKPFRGTIDDNIVNATLSVDGEILTGKLTFENTQTVRKLNGRLSYEGFFRVLAVGEDMKLSQDPEQISSSARGIFLTAERIVGTWSGDKSLGPVPMRLGLKDEEFYTYRQGEEDQEEELKFGHWVRRVVCINSKKDTTGIIRAEVPTMDSRLDKEKYPWSALADIHYQLSTELIYKQRCTCKQLEKNGGGEQVFRVANPSVQAGLLNLEGVGELNGEENLHLVQVYDLATGLQMRSDQDQSRFIP